MPAPPLHPDLPRATKPLDGAGRTGQSGHRGVMSWAQRGLQIGSRHGSKQRSKPGLSRGPKRLAIALVVLAGLLLAGLAALVPGSDALARSAEAALADALGVKVSVGAVRWRLLPTPAIELENLATAQNPPITIGLLTAYPDVASLLRQRLRLSRLEVQGMALPQIALAGLDAPLNPQSGALTLHDVPVAELVFTRVMWLTRTGLALNMAGHIRFDAGWKPRHAQLRLPDARDTAELQLTRQAQTDAWQVAIEVGGGTLNGQLQLDAADSGGLRLTGRLQPQNIEVAGLMQALNRRPFIAGRASGHTTLSARGNNLAGLAQSFTSQTQFSLGRSTLLQFDLDKAVRSLGRQHDGQTRLDSVSAQLVTQNTAEGVAFTFSNIQATSGALSASGAARLYQRRINATLAVDLVDGLLGVPLTITGPVSKVAVSVPASAVAGAAAGTLLLPGIGTAIGARLGAAMGNVLGGGPDASPANSRQTLPKSP